jgi:hypothetical protein
MRCATTQALWGGSESSLSQQWITISDGGPAQPIVLAVDFDATGRKDATFRDLVQLLPRPLTVWLSAQPPDSHRKALPPSEYLAWWADDSLRPPVSVGAVLGYCAGSLFASALADEIEQRQGFRPRVVLFNPGKPDATTLWRDFDGVIQSMSLLTGEERSAFLERGRKEIDADQASFDEVSDAIFELYGEASRITFQRGGIDADVGEELIEVFRSYISYLRATRDVEYREEWAEAAALVSRGHTQESAFTRTEIRSEVGREHLLGDRDVAQAVFRLIDSEA